MGAGGEAADFDAGFGGGVGEVFGVEGVEFGEFVDVGHIHRGFGDLGEAATGGFEYGFDVGEGLAVFGDLAAGDEFAGGGMDAELAGDEQEVAEAGGLVVGVVAGGEGGDVDGFGELHDCQLIALGSAGEAVAFAADGEDVFGGLGFLFEFLAEPGDVDVDGAGGDEGLVAPDLGEEPFAGEDLAAVIDEAAEELHLFGGEVDGGAVAVDGGDGEIDGDGAELEAGDGGEGFLAHAAEEGGDAGGEFVGVEGFGEVVVGAEVEALDAVGDLAAGGEHEDAAVEALLAHFLAEGEAVEAGEHDVEDEEVVAVVGGGAEAVGSGGGVGDVVALGGEEVGDDEGDIGFVFNEQDVRIRHIAPGGRRGGGG